ncbi:MAG: hypothetical protein B7Z39_03100 [Novosphingobium sp. 12-64-8]|uniref:MAPEG family protein n=1 Tax=Caenibius fulvus TaxID=2126012 RepID=UPI000BCAC50A|nr:MAG: hypothetical protein B7Z39_03100 [Novosphingobium sp. 12-64-8]
MEAKMLAPAAVLVAWSLFMLLWMTAVRLRALAKLGSRASKAKPGARGQDLDGVLPDEVNWKAHNYTHLTETPTLFYAAAVIVALLGASGTDVLAAWIYVALRIAHSLWQSMVNRIPGRLLLFTLSNLPLIYLAVRAIQLALFA